MAVLLSSSSLKNPQGVLPKPNLINSYQILSFDFTNLPFFYKGVQETGFDIVKVVTNLPGVQSNVGMMPDCNAKLTDIKIQIIQTWPALEILRNTDSSPIT